jgi:hypothetical protein
MAPITLLFAVTYILLGLGGFVLTGSIHKTALIPCAFGVLFILFGLLAFKEKLRKHAMHAAVLVAMLAFLGTAKALTHLPDLVQGTAEKPAAIITQSLNAGLSLLYIILAVRSFIQARRARSS